MQIDAAVSRGADSGFVPATLRLDEIAPDELLVRTVAVGMCHSDLTARALFPGGAVLGHEGGGIVEGVGAAVTGFAPGDHVVLSFDHCGHCRQCLRGRPYRCLNFGLANFSGVRPDGSATLRDDDVPVGGSFFGQSSFASHCIATARNAVKVDPDLPLDKLAPLGCGVITGCGTVLNALRPEPGSSLVVFGAGAVGLSAVLGGVISRVGTLIAVDIVPERRALAARLGATHVIDGRADDVLDQVRDITGGGADYAVEASGVASVARTAVSSVPEGGSVALVGIADLAADISLSHYEVVMGRSVSGVTEGSSVPQLFIPSLIGLWLRGEFPFDQMISSYPFAEINTAMNDSLAGTAIKPVLLF